MAKSVDYILQKGTGKPYLALFDSGGIPIYNPITGIPLGAYITQFSFLYDEEQENLATIVLDAGNPDIVDISGIQENQTLFLQWGYFFSNGQSVSSPVRCIKVRDLDCVFDDNGTHVTLKLVDGTGDLRYFPPYTYSEIEEYKLSSMLERGYMNDIGIIVQEYE